MKQELCEKLLTVSIVVLTFNSSKYVIETLESAYKQTYRGPLELIIADDCSTDDTVEKCEAWLKLHAGRFCRCEIIVPNENTGVSKNINRGCKAARGEWVKTIAGDDFLHVDCVENLIRYIEENSNVECGCYPVRVLRTENPTLTEEWMPVAPCDVVDFEYLCKFPFVVVPAPGYFFKKDMLQRVGYFPEIYRNIEDVPMLMRLLSHSVNIHIMESAKVTYRVHGGNLFLTMMTSSSLWTWVNAYDVLLKKHKWSMKLEMLYLPVRVSHVLGDGFLGRAASSLIFRFVRYILK